MTYKLLANLNPKKTSSRSQTAPTDSANDKIIQVNTPQTNLLSIFWSEGFRLQILRRQLITDKEPRTSQQEGPKGPKDAASSSSLN